jgi:hypothetical protein
MYVNSYTVVFCSYIYTNNIFTLTDKVNHQHKHLHKHLHKQNNQYTILEHYPT